MPDAWTIDDYTTLDLQTDGGVEDTPVAGITGVTIIPSVSIERLYTGDSIKIEEQKQFEFSVDVGISYSLWDEEASVVQQWLGGGGTSSATSMTDTSDPAKFQISGTFDSVGGDRTMDAEIVGITFEELPIIDGENGEFLSRDLSGTGEDITDLSMTDNSA